MKLWKLTTNKMSTKEIFLTNLRNTTVLIFGPAFVIAALIGLTALGMAVHPFLGVFIILLGMVVFLAVIFTIIDCES